MNQEIHKASKCFELYLDDKPIAFGSIVHQPCQIQNLKRLSRVVVLPDFQGIGIGYAICQFLAKMCAEKGIILDIATSAKNFICKLSKEKDWKLLNWGVQTAPNVLVKNPVRNRKLASFRFIGTKVMPRYSKHLHAKNTLRVFKKKHKVK